MDDTGRTTVVQEGQPGWVLPGIILVALVALIGLGVGWRGLSYAQESRQAINSDMQTMKAGYSKDVDSLQQRLTQEEKANTDLASDLGVVTKKLQLTQGQLAKARKDNEATAQEIRDENAKQLADMGTEMNGQLATKATQDDMKAANGQITGVRTDLDSTRKDLQMARSEMGTLIAKNHDDIDTLRRLGERDYVEFTIADKNKPQKVGDITVELKGTDIKKNQCNLALIVDDKRTEKRNRGVNEPIFFYEKGSHRATELVINQVEKNKITGYVSVPKAVQQSSSGN
jgi:hypothetical protein